VIREMKPLSNHVNQVRQKSREFILSAAKDGAVGVRVFGGVVFGLEILLLPHFISIRLV